MCALRRFGQKRIGSLHSSQLARRRATTKISSTPFPSLTEAVRRGEIWTAAGGKDYAGKPRPVVVVQDDAFDAGDSVTVCPFTTDRAEAPLFRLEVTPTVENGLSDPSRLMADKLTTVPRGKLRKVVGRLSDTDMLRLNRAMMVFLGLAGQTSN